MSILRILSKILIRRHRECWGIRLFKWNTTLIELWYAPRYFKIVPHSHPEETIELFFIYGAAMFGRTDGKTTQRFYAKFPRHFLKHFTIQPYHVHWFECSEKPLIFFNIERWNTNPTSASEDFKETKLCLEEEEEENIHRFR